MGALLPNFFLERLYARSCTKARTPGRSLEQSSLKRHTVNNVSVPRPSHPPCARRCPPQMYVAPPPRRRELCRRDMRCQANYGRGGGGDNILTSAIGGAVMTGALSPDHMGVRPFPGGICQSLSREKVGKRRSPGLRRRSSEGNEPNLITLSGN